MNVIALYTYGEIKEMQDDDWTDVSSVLANALTLLQQGPH